MKKDDFPESIDKLDDWIGSINDFNDGFETLIVGIVYLWNIRHLVKTETLIELLDATASAMEKQCKDCPKANECGDCTLKKNLDRMKASKEKINTN